MNFTVYNLNFILNALPAVLSRAHLTCDTEVLLFSFCNVKIHVSKTRDLEILLGIVDSFVFYCFKDSEDSGLIS
jgi:hypothetical protein